MFTKHNSSKVLHETCVFNEPISCGYITFVREDDLTVIISRNILSVSLTLFNLLCCLSLSKKRKLKGSFVT